MADLKDQKSIQLDVDSILFDRKQNWRELFARLSQVIQHSVDLQNFFLARHPTGGRSPSPIHFYEPLLIVHRFVKFQFLEATNNPDAAIFGCFDQALQQTIDDIALLAKKEAESKSSLFSWFQQKQILPNPEITALQSFHPLESTEDIGAFFNQTLVTEQTKRKIAATLEECYLTVLLNFSPADQLLIQQKAKDSLHKCLMWRNFFNGVYNVNVTAQFMYGASKKVSFDAIRDADNEVRKEYDTDMFNGCEAQKFIRQRRIISRTAGAPSDLIDHFFMFESCYIASVLCFLTSSDMSAIGSNVFYKSLDQYYDAVRHAKSVGEPVRKITDALAYLKGFPILRRTVVEENKPDEKIEIAVGRSEFGFPIVPKGFKAKPKFQYPVVPLDAGSVRRCTCHNRFY